MEKVNAKDTSRSLKDNAGGRERSSEIQLRCFTGRGADAALERSSGGGTGEKCSR